VNLSKKAHTTFAFDPQGFSFPHAASSGHSVYNPWRASLGTIASFVQISL